LIVGVLVELSNKNIDKIFEYSVPKELEKDIKIGIRVAVPFGKMNLEGFVLEIKSNKSTEKDLREVSAIVDLDIVLNDELLELGKKIQKRTLATLISCYQVMLPKALKAKRGSVINIKYDTFYKLNNEYSLERITDKQQMIINLVRKKGRVLRKELADISTSSLKTLLNKGVLLEEKQEHYRVGYNTVNIKKKELTEEQKKTVEDVVNNAGGVYLLHGVTGSGKTEVFKSWKDEYCFSS